MPAEVWGEITNLQPPPRVALVRITGRPGSLMAKLLIPLPVRGENLIARGVVVIVQAKQEIRERLNMVRLDFYGLAKRGERLLEFALFVQRDAQVIVGI